MTGIPSWLQAHLERTGAANTDGISRTVRTAVCHCGRTVLTGLDADPLGLAATTDPQPVSQLGEATALIIGAATYDLTPRGGIASRLELNHRDPWQIRGQRKWPVMAQHKCGITWPVDPNPPTLPQATLQLESAEVPF